ncbi:hypothetical protein GGX14DRAFT_557714 [Mycena pura]|uniref:DUF6534 domain-containing protein n=1 Tax=Mycena pura TaxID=153505 RepID=A0AAD6YLJ2_9AGAR|nr:hypothetical protein GGX14DRAFT_557714 [Mycena pura]
MSTAASVIQLAPASAAFVEARTTTLGPWVLGAFLDCILMGVIFCQTFTYYRTRTVSSTTLQRYYNHVVLVALGLSMLKTAQCTAVVWVQSVLDVSENNKRARSKLSMFKFANPDAARTLAATAWWQVSMPLLTGVIGTTVQSFFCLRFYMLSRNWMLCVVIICAMCLGLAGVCLSLANILFGNAHEKIMWLMVHLVCVFIADLMITSGTIYSLQKRNSGLQRTTLMINRLLRLVFESAFPPTLIATTDLIMTQILGPKLLWHMLLNIALGKIYVVSLLYTLNSINEYRADRMSEDVFSYNDGPRRANMELSARHLSQGQGPVSKTDQIFVLTQISTHVSPPYTRPASSSPYSPAQVKSVDFIRDDSNRREPSRDNASSESQLASDASLFKPIETQGKSCQGRSVNVAPISRAKSSLGALLYVWCGSMSPAQAFH